MAMKLTVTVEVLADVDGWARARGINAATALSEILRYLRTTDPTDGQSFLCLDKPASAHFDLADAVRPSRPLRIEPVQNPCGKCGREIVEDGYPVHGEAWHQRCAETLDPYA